MAKRVFTVREIAEFLAAEFEGEGDLVIEGLATLSAAQSGQLSFIANTRYQKYLSSCNASAVIVSVQDRPYFPGTAIISDNPYLGYARVSQLFANSHSFGTGIAPSAVIDASAQVANSAVIAAGVVIGPNTQVEENVSIGPNTVLGSDCYIGAGTRLAANVTLYDDVRLGQGCLIHSGAVIGADGFGFANERGEWVKIAQLGGVRIGNRVEVGACTTIDRGALEHTTIADGVILDNQIQIAHNVQIGKNSAIAGCTAVAGSTKIGDHCTIAGACGITGHLEIADGTHVTAMSLISKSITEPGAYSSGTGMMPHKQWKKNVVRFRQLDDLARRVKSIEDSIIGIKGSK